MSGGTQDVRDLVEIGMGRTARRSYELDDVEIVPSRRTRSSQVVSTGWQIDAYRFDIPLITHPSDAIVSPDIAVAVGQLGGLGVLNAEGLWARHANVTEALAGLAALADAGESPSALVQRLQHALGVEAGLVEDDDGGAGVPGGEEAGIGVLGPAR